MFQKILIANRGEIALRIIRTAREMGIETVAVYSEADKESLHVSLADEAICIGPALSAKSYLNVQSLIAAAEASGADAIHPGYGFLAENADFCRMCKEHNITFIGPSAENIERMGDKNTARKTMQEAGIPTVPGSKEIVTSEAELKRIAKEVGLPLMIKASSGGGGKGMRIIKKQDKLVSGFNQAQAEAKAAFNDGRVYIEKYIESPRHIEVQLLSDGKNAIHLGDRDCSIQRRHQKLLEEAPSYLYGTALFEKMGDLAVKAALFIKYKGVGTIEFLVDQNNNVYFMEMNTRIQVEHPITECITNVDLIKEQLYIAAGEALRIKQKDINFHGHSIECRINAEDVANDFRPSAGELSLYLAPGGPGVRVDSHAYQGYKIPPFF